MAPSASSGRQRKRDLVFGRCFRRGASGLSTSERARRQRRVASEQLHVYVKLDKLIAAAKTAAATLMLLVKSKCELFSCERGANELRVLLNTSSITHYPQVIRKWRGGCKFPSFGLFGARARL